MINEKLAEEKCLSREEKDRIEELHSKRNDYYNRMEVAPTSDLKEWDRHCTELGFELQSIWGFPLDAKYHKFWERPRCKCCKMDNRDRLGTGYYIINQLCPLHGE